MLIIEQIKKTWGIEFMDYQKKLLNELSTIPNNAKLACRIDGRMCLVEDKKNV